MKKINFIPIIFIVFGFFCKPAISQIQSDTLILMNYNSGNFGFPATVNCPLLNPVIKEGYLKTIVQYVNPDILALTKMDASPTTFATDTVLDKVLNAVCPSCYNRAAFTNVSGYYKVNMLYYKTNKVGFISTITIYSADNNISDIDMHKLYYKSPNLATTHDTIFINIIVAHLASGVSSASERATEIAGAMAWLNAHINTAGNYIFTGDFNTQNSTEACFQDMINSANSNTKFYDPPNQLGDWSGSPSLFANYLTQSTRITDPGDCNATGGINNRYDHILCTQPIIAGTYSVSYIPNTYKVIGQDGLHTGLAINASPTNTSAPSAVINALYYMSEHLPDELRLHITYNLPTGIHELWEKDDLTISPNPSSLGIFSISSTNNDQKIIEVYNSTGEIIYTTKTTNQQSTLDLSKAAKGIYFVKITTGKNVMNKKIIL